MSRASRAASFANPPCTKESSNGAQTSGRQVSPAPHLVRDAQHPELGPTRGEHVPLGRDVKPAVDRPTTNLSGATRYLRRKPAQSWLDAAHIGLAGSPRQWEVHSQHVAERLPRNEPRLRATIGNRLSGATATRNQGQTRNPGKA